MYKLFIALLLLTIGILLGLNFKRGAAATNFQAPQANTQDPSIRQNDKLRNDIDSIQNQLRTLQGRVATVEVKAGRFQSLPLDPKERKYGRIDSVSGSFLIMVKDVRPYLDGYRISLMVGNPSTATYDGFKLKIGWSKTLPEWNDQTPNAEWTKKMNDWTKSQQEKTFDFTESLRPGTWNSINFVAAPATPDEVEQLEIESMETNMVSMFTKR